MKSITLFKIALFSLLLATLIPAHAQNYTKITYVHSDADGTPFAATDSQGNVEWQIDHYPYGKEYSNTQVARKNDISFAGKPYDEEIGLSYFGGRWYDPDIGRFTGIDPMPVNPNDYRTFNRYSYGFNNPYKYVDPDGNLPFLIPVAIFIAKEIAAEAASRATGGATDFLSVRRMGTKALKKGASLFTKKNSDNVTSSIPTEKYNRKKHYGGSQTNSHDAKIARQAGEGQPCPTCGQTQISGTQTAPSPQHEPTLVEHYYEHGGHAMTDAQRRAYAKSKGINGSQCITCQRKEGAEASRYSRKQAEKHKLKK